MMKRFEGAIDGFERSGGSTGNGLNDVWIGTEAMIMSGIKVGDGAIIAEMRAVVTKRCSAILDCQFKKPCVTSVIVSVES